jgi:ubiquinone/menaquinone biosynthesis C-methylase UbiE
MYSNKEAIRMFEQMVEMGDYFSSGRPVYVSPEIIVNDICSKIPLHKNDIILDVGCGSGLLTIPFAQKCKYVYGLDAGKKVLKKAKENCKVMKISNIAFCMGLATELPFKDKLFDKVVMYAVIHYLENTHQIEWCIRELIRVCKKEGHILIAEIPEKKAKEEFESREKTREELKILEEFKSNREQYDKLFKEKVSTKPQANTLIIDGNILIKIAEKEGRIVKMHKQDIRQPFSLTRRDLVIYPARRIM